MAYTTIIWCEKSGRLLKRPNAVPISNNDNDKQDNGNDHDKDIDETEKTSIPAKNANKCCSALLQFQLVLSLGSTYHVENQVENPVENHVIFGHQLWAFSPEALGL